MRGNEISCDPETELPLVFDTRVLADFCLQDRQLADCVIVKLEMEELIRICRDSKIPFNKFMLIDKLSQL